MNSDKDVTANFEPEGAEPPPPTPPLPPLPPPVKADIKSYDFQTLTVGTVDPGATVSWKAVGQYRGMGQTGTMTILMGTGVAPAFVTKFTLPAVPVTFNESPDWQPFTFRNNFSIPMGVERGQSYNIRAKLESLTDPAQETDTDWGVIVITKGAEPPPREELPPAEFENLTVVKYTKKPWQGGECAVTVGYDYRGPALSKTLYAAIGKVTLGIFDEIYDSSVGINIAEAASWEYRLGRAEAVDIPNEARLGNYFLEVKLTGEGPDILSTRYPLEIIA